MPMIPANTAVRLLVGPLIDDTDFKARETGVAYNAAGMDVDLLKSDDTGTPTTTAITLTTAGVNDWLELSGGYYYVELTAAQNDTEGKLKLIGIATGILAFESIEFDVVPVAVYDALIAGTANIPADMIAVSGDTVAADNIEATYDGTGYTDNFAPAQQQQLSQIANVGAATNQIASATTITTGTEAANTYAVTEALDGVYHTFNDAAGVLDFYYTFQIGADGTPVSGQWTGYLQGGNDAVTLQAWDWVSSTWKTLGAINGSNPVTVQVLSFVMFPNYVGTGANFGEVRVRVTGTGLTSASFNTDQIFIGFSTSNALQGYEGGAIWIDTINGTAGTVLGVNGVVGRPCLTLADAIVLSGLANLPSYHLGVGSSIVLSQGFDANTFDGVHATVDLNGQSVSGAVFRECTITGNDSGTNAIPTHYDRCETGIHQLGLHEFIRCKIGGDVTVLEAGDVFWDYCSSGVAGNATPVFDFNAAGNTSFSCRHYSGGLECKNMASGDSMSFESTGQIIFAATCSGGSASLRGNHSKTDNSGGAVTITEDARVTVETIDTELSSVHGVGSWTGGITGARSIVISLEDGSSNPVLGASFSIYDATNTTLIGRLEDSDNDGDVTLNIDDGTYIVRINKIRFTPDNAAETLTVTSSETPVTYTGTPFAAPSAASPTLCSVYGFATDANGVARDGLTISFIGSGPIGVDEDQITAHRIDVVSGPTVANPGWATGYFEVDLVRLSEVRIIARKMHLNDLVITIPDEATAKLATLTEAAK